MAISLPVVSRSTFLATKTEVTPGTPITSTTGLVYTPVMSGGGFDPEPTQLTSNEFRGNRSDTFVYGQGVYAYKGKFNGIFYPHMSLPIYRMAFGTDTVTQPAAGTDPTVYLHTLSMNNTNDLISCTSFYNLWQASGSIDRFARTVVDKLTTKFDADKGWLEWSADLLAQTRAYQTGAVPATAYTTELPFQGWRGTITKGASAFYDLQNFEWSIENHWEGVYTATASQDPGTMAVGAMSNKVKATFVASKTLYDEFLADTESAWVVTFTSAAAISNTYYHQVVITLPKLHMTKADRPTGDVYVKLTTDMLPLYDSSSSGAVTMTVQNTHAATDY